MLAFNEYTRLLHRLEKFYSEYEKLWMTEKKPHSFDVQDVRLGGLIRRIKHCRKMLLDYANGKIERIEELEVKLLDFRGKGEEFQKGATTFNCYKEIAPVNYL